MQKPGFYGLNYSNRDFTQRDSWGKNQFNSSFPTSLANYLHRLNYENIYLLLNDKLEVFHSKISTKDLYGLEPLSENLFYSFESIFSPYEQFIVGSLPRIDLVTQEKDTGHVLVPLEIKMTALPDNSTFSCNEDKYGTEIVVRPDTIVYLACSIANVFKDSRKDIEKYFFDKFRKIQDWSDDAYYSVSSYGHIAKINL